jgi:CRISPR-associated protein Csm1
MASRIRERPENALWHSHFAYSTRRFVETRFKEIEDRSARESARRRLHGELAREIAGNGIEAHGPAYKIALFIYLYQQRD